MQFHQRVALQRSGGEHLRFVPGNLARALVSGGNARVPDSGGKVRSISLISSASSVAEIIGPPTGSVLGGVRFTRYARLDGPGIRVIEFHPRSFY